MKKNKNVVATIAATMLMICAVVSLNPVRASTALAGVSSQYPLGTELLNNPSTATGLTLPAGTLHAYISVRSAGTMFCDTPACTLPTSSSGFYFPAGTVIVVSRDPKWLQAMRFRCSDDGACRVYVTYYRDRKANE